jgi:hypothetical protein
MSTVHLDFLVDQLGTGFREEHGLIDWEMLNGNLETSRLNHVE